MICNQDLSDNLAVFCSIHVIWGACMFGFSAYELHLTKYDNLFIVHLLTCLTIYFSSIIMHYLVFYVYVWDVMIEYCKWTLIDIQPVNISYYSSFDCCIIIAYVIIMVEICKGLECKKPEIVKNEESKNDPEIEMTIPRETAPTYEG